MNEASSEERVACAGCGGWVYHLAARCPHCGRPTSAAASAAPAAPGAARPLSLSADEARALLAVTAPPRVNEQGFAMVARELVLPRTGALELVTSVLAAPLTACAVLLGGRLLRSKQPGGSLLAVELLGVPLVAVSVAASLWDFGVPWPGWAALGASVAAWAVRALARRPRDVLR